MTETNKNTWETPKLADLDVSKTLGGIVVNASEATIFGFDAGGNPVTGEDS